MNSRADREQKAYDAKGIKRDRYNRILSHSSVYYWPYIRKRFAGFYAENAVRDVLEIGTASWYPFIFKNNLLPESLTCINISEAERRKGIALSPDRQRFRTNLRFLRMDAHQLEFEDGQFDLVFGGGILHHLDIPSAVSEIHRVLRPAGAIWFKEPLGINPVANLIRAATPRLRTEDERPLNRKALREIKALFTTEYMYEALVSVPAGIVSRLLFHSPENMLTRTAFMVDRTMAGLPYFGLLYRNIIIMGKKRAAGKKPGR